MMSFNRFWLTPLALTLLLAAPGIALCAVNVEAESLARWQLNYADYLVDVGKYLEAVEYIDSAYEMSTHPKNRVDALLAKAMVMATFLDAPDKAVEVYRTVSATSPDHAEYADYQSAFLLMQMNKYHEAGAAFRAYLEKYPQGRFRIQIEAMFKSMEEGQPLPPTQVFTPEDRPVLRVALHRRGRRFVAEPGKANALICVDDMECSSRVVVEPSKHGLIVNGKALEKRSVLMRSDHPFKTDAGTGAKRIRGYVKISLRGGRLLVLNMVDIEEYLLSVVPSESYPSWPMETLKAQAVAARTYAYYQQLHRKGRDYDLVDHIGDQMYGGYDREHTRTTRAVKTTAGHILTYEGKPILSQYTANSGGHTADAGAVFSTPKPYLVAHADPASRKGKMASWKRTYTTARIVEALKGIGINATGLTAIEPAMVGPSGRLIKVRLKHAKGSTVVRTRTTLASSRALKLPEVLMEVEFSNGTYTFRGRGHGHGVGYSQWGSAELGKTMQHDRILQFYYPKSQLNTGWN